MGTDESQPGTDLEGDHTSGLTSRLILEYVERERGRDGVEQLLGACALEGHEERLQDEDSWFAFETKIQLLEAACEVLEDPSAPRSIGAAVLDLNVASGLKLALRACGSARTVYENVVAAAGKFTWAHRWEIVELEDTHARLRYRDVAGVGYRRADCEYNIGLVSCVPEIFGMPPARVRHGECAVKGADACVYEVSWGAPASPLRLGVASTVAGAVLAGVAHRFARPLTPLAAAVPAVGASLAARRSLRARRRRLEGLEASARERGEVADRLAASLQDLVSEIRLDDVLDKITHHARSAVGGKEFALLLSGDPGHSRRSAGVSEDSLRTLERWASEDRQVFHARMVIEDMAEVPTLAPLATRTRSPLGSLCSAPLVFGEQQLGVLVALSHAPQGFLPSDPALLESYAAQAAIAVAHGRTVETLETQARQDHLTGLLNHREFHESLERELDRCKRYGSEMSLVLLDIDRLKAINDAHGHVEGDRVLRAVGEKIREACRASDIACRVGGDEFGLVLPESETSDAAAVGDRARRAVEELDLGISISYGVAMWPSHGSEKDDLLMYADRALYDAKPAR